MERWGRLSPVSRSLLVESTSYSIILVNHFAWQIISVQTSCVLDFLHLERFTVNYLWPMRIVFATPRMWRRRRYYMKQSVQLRCDFAARPRNHKGLVDDDRRQYSISTPPLTATSNQIQHLSSTVLRVLVISTTATQARKATNNKQRWPIKAHLISMISTTIRSEWSLERYVGSQNLTQCPLLIDWLIGWLVWFQPIAMPWKYCFNSCNWQHVFSFGFSMLF